MGSRIVHIVRHGETEWSRASRVQGWAPVPLTRTGHEQAQQVASHLSTEYDIDTLISSDLRRTRETAEHVSDTTGLPLTFDSQWRERHFGIYQGLSDDRFYGDYPQFDYGSVGDAAFSESPEGGESWYSVHERISSAWDELLTHSFDTAVVMTHTGVLGTLVSLLMDEELAVGFENDYDYCGVTTVTIDEDDSVAVTSTNDTSFLSPSE